MVDRRDNEVRQHVECLHVRTLCRSLSECFMKFIDNLLEAVRWDFLPVGVEEVQLNVPFAQWHLQSSITATDTMPVS